MNLQYISDKSGHTTAIQLQIPIEEWDNLKRKYKELADEENAANTSVPDWQIELGRKELEKINSGTADLLSWEESKKHFKF